MPIPVLMISQQIVQKTNREMKMGICKLGFDVLNSNTLAWKKA